MIDNPIQPADIDRVLREANALRAMAIRNAVFRLVRAFRAPRLRQALHLS